MGNETSDTSSSTSSDSNPHPTQTETSDSSSSGSKWQAVPEPQDRTYRDVIDPTM